MSETIEIYGLLSDLVQAALNGLNLWPAVLGGVVSGVLIGLPMAARLLIGLCLTLVFTSLWPLLSGLPPLAPDFGEPEYAIQFALMAVVVAVIVMGLGCLRLLAFGQRKPRTSCMS
ncbi:hypothetical protein [Asticcacaulis sp. AND118]|uniref:hypothetical protein n=1 Tax=Asticcacaulis sp. AND118 TaxID=2840468 RepID=UPI001CFF5E94|nr:hypothetical protein [Asticcacaulis sp. AND118]UDF03516.1 hypothetical protein LH365_00310 [Asticcacaulis sp. AND118]